jgi:hypothetical protein
MSLDSAIERLYHLGWRPLGHDSNRSLSKGRAYPSSEEVRQEFAAAGLRFHVEHVPLLGCYRAVWEGNDPRFSGYCVGTSEAEAAVAALAELIRLPAIAAGAIEDPGMIGA